MIDKETGRQYVENENDVLSFNCDGVKIERTPKQFMDLYNEFQKTTEKFIGMTAWAYQNNCKGGCMLPSKDFVWFSKTPDCYEATYLYSGFVTMRCFWNRNGEWFHIPSELFNGNQTVEEAAKDSIKEAIAETNEKINSLIKNRDSVLETLKSFNIKID